MNVPSNRFAIRLLLMLLVSASMSTNAEANSLDSPVSSVQASPQGKIITLRGKRMYVEVRGSKDAPVMLYLHGGPGSGSYDFAVHQGERLSRRLRLVMLDQRGVLRSDSLAADEPFGLQDIIEDCEALRKHMGVERWSVLGHSFGGVVAIRYALAYPDSVEKLLLESPALDFASTARSLLRGAASEFRAAGQPQMAEECLSLKRCYEAWDIPVVLCAGTTGVALFPADTSEPQPAPDPRHTKIMRHFAFRVSRASLDEARAEFRRRGVEFEFADHGISRSIYVYDPDGYRVELTTYEV